jgi:hypothetical protein
VVRSWARRAGSASSWRVKTGMTSVSRRRPSGRLAEGLRHERDLIRPQVEAGVRQGAAGGGQGHLAGSLTDEVVGLPGQIGRLAQW